MDEDAHAALQTPQSHALAASKIADLRAFVDGCCSTLHEPLLARSQITEGRRLIDCAGGHELLRALLALADDLADPSESVGLYEGLRAGAAIGDGSCLFHAFLTCASASYRCLASHAARRAIGQALRAALAHESGAAFFARFSASRPDAFRLYPTAEVYVARLLEPTYAADDAMIMHLAWRFRVNIFVFQANAAEVHLHPWDPEFQLRHPAWPIAVLLNSNNCHYEPLGLRPRSAAGAVALSAPAEAAELQWLFEPIASSVEDTGPLFLHVLMPLELTLRTDLSS